MAGIINRVENRGLFSNKYQAVFKHSLPRRPINFANTQRGFNGSAAH